MQIFFNASPLPLHPYKRYSIHFHYHTYQVTDSKKTLVPDANFFCRIVLSYVSIYQLEINGCLTVNTLLP